MSIAKRPPITPAPLTPGTPSDRSSLMVLALSTVLAALGIVVALSSVIDDDMSRLGWAAFSLLVSLSFFSIWIIQAAANPHTADKKSIRALERLRSYLANEPAVFDTNSK